MNERIGNKIRVQKICFNITIGSNLVNFNPNGSVCKWVIYHNKQANGLLPSFDLMWGSNAINAFRNTQKDNQIAIVKQGQHNMVVTGNTSTGTITAAGPLLKDLTVTIYPNKVINYTLGTSLIADLKFDDYGFGIIADGVNCCQCTINSKVFFTDY